MKTQVVEALRMTEAQDRIRAIPDTKTRDLVRHMYGEFLARFFQRVDVSDEDHRRQLPISSMDMVFLVECLIDGMRKHAVLERVLRGEPLFEDLDE